MAGATKRKGEAIRRDPLVVALIASLVAHLLCVTVGPERARPPTSQRPDASLIEITWLTIDDAAPPASTPRASAMLPASGRRSAGLADPRRVRSQVVGASVRAGTDDAETHVEPGSVGLATADRGVSSDAALPLEPSTSAGLARPPSPAAISPEAAARTVIGLPTLQQQAVERGVALSESLRATAMARPHLDRRAPPSLRRMPDGGFAYRGPAFAARIHPDGRVSFHNRVVHPDGSVSFPEGTEHAGVNFTPFRFDLTDAMLSAMGEELYPAEKRWFLEQTETLRMELEADDRLRWFARARQALIAQLTQISNDARLTMEQRRNAIFALWADCADDEVGGRGRAVIEGFVRERFPQGTVGAFSSHELQRLNQRNAAAPRFEPYATPKPASP